jgi:hypothetical protein
MTAMQGENLGYAGLPQRPRDKFATVNLFYS